MPGDGGSTPEALTRREALKRGAVFGGALLWTTPAVQAIGMSRAVAQEVSGPCRTYCIKYNFHDPDTTADGDWEELGTAGNNPNASGNIFVCPTDSENGPYPGNGLPEFEVRLAGDDRKDAIIITFPDSCTLAETTEDSPDELALGNVAAKCGVDGENIQNLTLDSMNEIRVEPCGNGLAISHIELLVRCC